MVASAIFKVKHSQAVAVANYLFDHFDGNVMCVREEVTLSDSYDFADEGNQRQFEKFLTERIHDFEYVLFLRNEVNDEEVAYSVRQENDVYCRCSSQKYTRILPEAGESLESICDRYDIDYTGIDKAAYDANRKGKWIGKVGDRLIYSIPWTRTTFFVGGERKRAVG